MAYGKPNEASALNRPVAGPGTSRGTAGAAAAEVEDRETPRGTLAILLVYAAVIVVLWGYMYAEMLLRR